MPFILAAMGTIFLFLFAKRYVNFVKQDYNTQAFVDPDSVPDRSLLNDADHTTVMLSQAVTIPMAQIASGWGETFTPNPLNPSVAPLTFGNKALDTPTPVYLPHQSLPMT